MLREARLLEPAASGGINSYPYRIIPQTRPNRSFVPIAGSILRVGLGKVEDGISRQAQLGPLTAESLVHSFSPYVFWELFEPVGVVNGFDQGSIVSRYPYVLHLVYDLPREFQDREVLINAPPPVFSPSAPGRVDAVRRRNDLQPGLAKAFRPRLIAMRVSVYPAQALKQHVNRGKIRDHQIKVHVEALFHHLRCNENYSFPAWSPCGRMNDRAKVSDYRLIQHLTIRISKPRVV